MKPSRRLAVILAAVALLAPAGAGAQHSDTRIGHDATAKDGPAVLQMMAECFVLRQPDLVHRWLEMLPGSREEHDLLVRYEPELGTCLDNRKMVMDGKQISFKPALFRMPVAVAAARRLLPKAPATPPVAANSDPWFLPRLKQLGSQGQVDRTALTLMDFGHCVATHQWHGTLAIVGAEPKSTEERQAVTALRPVLGPCLPAEAKVTLTPANLRQLVAEPVLHILNGEVAAAEAVR